MRPLVNITILRLTVVRRESLARVHGNNNAMEAATPPSSTFSLHSYDRTVDVDERDLSAAAGGAAMRCRGRLAALVSEVAVFGAARMVLQGFSAPDGQEWAHRCGRVAAVRAAP